MKKAYRLIRYNWPLHFILLFTNWLPDNIIFLKLRGLLARPFFKKCGKNLMLGRNLTLNDSPHIEIGDNVYIAYGCWFSVSDGLVIEDEVMFGPYCVIATSNHTPIEGSFRYGPSLGSRISIGRGSWIGSHCVIVEGATIGCGVKIGANSIVHTSTIDHSLYAGSPVQFIKHIE